MPLSYSPSLFSSEKPWTCWFFIDKALHDSYVSFFHSTSFFRWRKRFLYRHKDTGTVFFFLLWLNVFRVLFSTVFNSNVLFAFMTALYCWVEFLKRPGTVTLVSLSRLAKANLEVVSIYVQWEFLSRVYCFACNKNCLPSAIVSPCHSASWKPSATFHNVFQFGMSWIILCHLQILSHCYLFPFVDHLWIFQTTRVLYRFLWWQL